MNKFEKLLSKGAETQHRLDELERPHKLSAAAFLRDAIKIAGSSPGRLDKLEAALKRPEFVSSNQFYRIAKKWIREGSCTCSPTEMRRISWMGKIDEVTAELASVQSSPFELFALAVRSVTRECAEAFGDIEDWEAFQKETTDTKDMLENLFGKIEKAYTSSDLIVEDVDKEGRGRVSFKVTKGAVCLGDKFPERLVRWLVAHPKN